MPSEPSVLLCSWDLHYVQGPVQGPMEPAEGQPPPERPAADSLPDHLLSSILGRAVRLGLEEGIRY